MKVMMKVEIGKTYWVKIFSFYWSKIFGFKNDKSFCFLHFGGLAKIKVSKG